MSFQQNTVAPYPATTQNVANTQVQVNTGAVVTQPEPQHFDVTPQLILACCVLLGCNWIFGLIAFVLAMVASSAASEGDYEKARMLARSSTGVSVAGIIITVILILTVVIYVTV